MVTSERLNELADEEEQTAEMYDDLGFPGEARDERQHAKKFRKLAQKVR